MLYFYFKNDLDFEEVGSSSNIPVIPPSIKYEWKGIPWSHDKNKKKYLAENKVEILLV